MFKKIVNFQIQKFIVLSIVYLFTLSVRAQCQLPVCDIPLALKQLENLNQSDRAQSVKNLRVSSRGTTDAKVYENLKEFSLEAKKLLVQLKEEDWVIREANYLLNFSLVGLIKYSEPIEKVLKENFDLMSEEGSVFDVLNYWATNVESLVIVKEVLAVVSFAEYVKAWALRTKQEAYLIREADTIISLGGKHVSRLNPFHEGTFSITTSCSPRPQDCLAGYGIIAHLSIMDLLGAKGLVVSFSDFKTNMTSYLYTTAELTKNGTRIRGISTEATPFTRVSEVMIDLDPVTGFIKGTLKDVEYPGILHFEGKPKRRISEYYNDSEGASRMISSNEVLGRYKGKFAGNNAELVVSKYSSGEIVGSITYSEHVKSIQFRAGAYHSQRGVLVLTGASSGEQSDRKLVLALRKDSQGVEYFKGFMYTSNPQTPIVDYFYKISEN